MLKHTLFCLLLIATSQAQAVFLSTSSTATLGGLSFRSGDIVDYEPATGQARLVWAGSFVDTENIDAGGRVAAERKILVRAEPQDFRRNPGVSSQ